MLRTDKRIRPYSGRMYSVLGFNPQGPEGGQVTVYDPYGQDMLGGSGIITLSFNEFLRNFGHFGVAQQQ